MDFVDGVDLRWCFEFEHDLVFNYDVSSEVPSWSATETDSDGDLALSVQASTMKLLGEGKLIDRFDETATEFVVFAVESAEDLVGEISMYEAVCLSCHAARQYGTSASYQLHHFRAAGC